MVMNKNAQFFLLAAVIISVVVISLGITANRATINREPGNFYDYSYEVKRETGAVLDYEIYTEIEGGELGEFVELLSGDIRDKNPDADFRFIYGNNTYLVEQNSGSTGAGAGTFNTICFGGSCQDISGTVGEHDSDAGITTWDADDLGGSENFTIEVDGHEFSFPISRHKQVIFIMQKDVKDESFVTAR